MKQVVLCPFHEEKTPSMVVEDGDFHCLSCGVEGDIVNAEGDKYSGKLYHKPPKEDFKINEPA